MNIIFRLELNIWQLLKLLVVGMVGFNYLLWPKLNLNTHHRGWLFPATVFLSVLYQSALRNLNTFRFFHDNDGVLVTRDSIPATSRYRFWGLNFPRWCSGSLFFSYQSRIFCDHLSQKPINTHKSSKIPVYLWTLYFLRYYIVSHDKLNIVFFDNLCIIWLQPDLL